MIHVHERIVQVIDQMVNVFLELLALSFICEYHVLFVVVIVCGQVYVFILAKDVEKPLLICNGGCLYLRKALQRLLHGFQLRQYFLSKV